jgi:outer membrane protein TolC
VPKAWVTTVSREAARQELAVRVAHAYAEWHGGTVKATAYEKSLQSLYTLLRLALHETHTSTLTEG